MPYLSDSIRELIAKRAEEWDAQRQPAASAPSAPYTAYVIPSNSEPGKTYDVVLYNDSDRAECSCKGYGYRRRCSHIEDARALRDLGLDGTAEVYSMPALEVPDA